MLRVKTKLDKSLISGIGLFADQYIKQGDIVWQQSVLSVLVISKDEYGKLPEIDQIFLKDKDYYWIDNGDYIIPIDDCRFINHSYFPNVIDQNDISIAAKNIDIGEELTMDYRTLIPQEQWESYFS